MTYCFHPLVSTLFLMILVFISGATLAASDSAKIIRKNSFDKIPDEIFQEADDFREECYGDIVRGWYYNCECLAYEYLEERIKNPKIPKSSITLAISNKCADASGAAGFQYDQCINSRVAVDRNKESEEYCTCFSNMFARLYEQSGQAPSTSLYGYLQSQAMIACYEPDLARRFYPDIAPAMDKAVKQETPASSKGR